MDSERVGLTLWDSAGLEKSIVDLQLREMSTFIESKFEETFAEEQKVMRSPGFRDTHIHCVFLVLDPLRLDANLESASPGEGGLDDGLEVQVLRAMWEKTVVIPVIAKADTLTVKHMAHLKRAVWKSIRDNSMNPLDALELEDDEEEADGGDSNVLVEEDEDADFSESEPQPTQLVLAFVQVVIQRRKSQVFVQARLTYSPCFSGGGYHRRRALPSALSPLSGSIHSSQIRLRNRQRALARVPVGFCFTFESSALRLSPSARLCLPRMARRSTRAEPDTLVRTMAHLASTQRPWHQDAHQGRCNACRRCT
jgi:hypothetical protein